MNTHLNCLTILILLFTLSCNVNRVDKDLKGDNNGLQVNCHISKLRIQHVSDEEKRALNIRTNTFSYVYGKLSISNNTNSAALYNLNDYYLSIGNRISSKIYIDSVATYNINKKTIGPAQINHENVYWVFEGDLSKEDINEMILIKKRRNEKNS